MRKVLFSIFHSLNMQFYYWKHYWDDEEKVCICEMTVVRFYTDS